MSLLDNATPATPAGTPPAAAATPTATPPAEGTPPVAPVVDGSWYYDDNIKGDGARPEWLKDKYKTAAEQAKAYVEVEKKLGAFKGAPDKYDLTLTDYPELKFSEEDPMLKGFIEGAKKNGVSQEYVSELLNVYAQAITAGIPDPTAEIAKLGPNANQDLQILGQWASANFTPEEFEVFKCMTTTADSIRFFDKVRQISTRSDVAPPGQPHVQRETKEQVLQSLNDPRYQTDPEFRAEVRRRLAHATGEKVTS